MVSVIFSGLTSLFSIIGAAALIKFFLERKYKVIDERRAIYSHMLDLLQKIDSVTVDLFNKQEILFEENRNLWTSKFESVQKILKLYSDDVEELYADPYKTKSDLESGVLSQDKFLRLSIKIFDQDRLIDKNLKEIDLISNDENSKYVLSASALLSSYIQDIKLFQKALFEIPGRNALINTTIEDSLTKFEVKFNENILLLEKHALQLKEFRQKKINLGVIIKMLYDLGGMKSKLLNEIGKKR